MLVNCRCTLTRQSCFPLSDSFLKHPVLAEEDVEEVEIEEAEEDEAALVIEEEEEHLVVVEEADSVEIEDVVVEEADLEIEEDEEVVSEEEIEEDSVVVIEEDSEEEIEAVSEVVTEEDSREVSTEEVVELARGQNSTINFIPYVKNLITFVSRIFQFDYCCFCYLLHTDLLLIK